MSHTYTQSEEISQKLFAAACQLGSLPSIQHKLEFAEKVFLSIITHKCCQLCIRKCFSISFSSPECDDRCAIRDHSVPQKLFKCPLTQNEELDFLPIATNTYHFGYLLIPRDYFLSGEHIRTSLLNFIGILAFSMENEVQRVALSTSASVAQAHETKFRSLFENMHEAFALHEIICDQCGTPIDYRFLAINRKFEQFTSLVAPNIIGKTALEVIPNLEKNWIERYGKIALTGEPHQFEEFSAPLNRWYEVLAFSPEPKTFATIFRDITERKNAEEDNIQREKLIAIGQLAAGVAHDFNNQLVGILSNAELICMESEEQGRINAYASDIKRSALRASNLTKQLLAFSRKGKYQAIPIDLHEILQDLIPMLRRTFSSRIKLTSNLDAQSARIVGDPNQLHNAFLNLALNARDAITAEGQITYRTRQVEDNDPALTETLTKLSKGRYLEVSISDNGSGMSIETQRRMFEPFFTTKRQNKGTGLGLAAVYGTILNHEGSISIESEVGRGSTIRLFFPMSEERTEEKTEKAPQPTTSILYCNNNSTRQQKQILVIEDDEDVRNVEVAILEALGYIVTSFANPIEALVFYESNAHFIDLVILDMEMPEMSGRDAFMKMKLHNPQILAVLVSGYAVDDQVQESLKLGIKEFLQKPFTFQQLSLTLKNVLAK